MYKWNANNQDTSHSTYTLVWFLIQTQTYRTPKMTTPYASSWWENLIKLLLLVLKERKMNVRHLIPFSIHNVSNKRFVNNNEFLRITEPTIFHYLKTQLIQMEKIKRTDEWKCHKTQTPYESPIMNEYLIIPKVKERKLAWKDDTIIRL